MQKEACLICNHTICIPEGKGRRMFTIDNKSLELKLPIQECHRYLSVAIIGTLSGDTIIYREKTNSKLWSRK